MTDEELQSYLDDNGYPPHIVQGGREGLIRRWNEFVTEVEHGYRYSLEDYRNDLDVRGVLALAGLDADVEEADHRLRGMLTGTDHRIWESVAQEGAFWDYGYPRNAGGWLLRDLRSEGLVE